MKVLHIDFSAHRVGRTSSFLWLLCILGCVATVAGIAAGAVLANKARTTANQARDLLAQQASLSEAILHQEEVPPTVAAAANGAISRLNYPIIELLTELERHATPEVRVISVELGPDRSSLRVVVQAANIPQVLDYMDQIKKERDFQEVTLTHQEPITSGNSQDSSRFTLSIPQQSAATNIAASGAGAGSEDTP